MTRLISQNKKETSRNDNLEKERADEHVDY